jgi:hypothetical protein
MSRRPTSPTPPEGRVTDRAFVLPLLTLFLLTPPIITIFDAPVTIAGIPLLHVYCFGMWAAAIVAGRFMAKKIARSATAAPDGRGAHRPPPDSG